MMRSQTSPLVLTAKSFADLQRAMSDLADWQRTRQQLHARRTNWHRSHAWKLIEAEQLRRFPRCQRCDKADTLLIRYRHVNSYGLEALDMASLETICENCTVAIDEMDRFLNNLL